MDKVGAPYYFHTVVGGGHNPYFGLKNAAGGCQNAVASNFGFAGFLLGTRKPQKKANKRLYRASIRARCERSFANGEGKWAIQFPASNLASGS